MSVSVREARVWSVVLARSTLSLMRLSVGEMSWVELCERRECTSRHRIVAMLREEWRSCSWCRTCEVLESLGTVGTRTALFISELLCFS